MIKFAICDDCVSVTEHIKEYITNFDFNCEYQIDCFDNGVDLSKSDCDYDLIFLDIEMPVQDGIETAQQIRHNNKDVEFVYVTDYSEYAISSFSVHPFDFILKPVNPKKISKVIGDFIEYKKKDEVEAVIEFKGISGDVIVNINDIMYLEYYDNRRIHVYTNSKVFDIKGSLAEFIPVLEEHDFYSTHKSFLVNLNYIDTVNKKNAVMKNGQEIPISQKKYPDFKKQLYEYFHAYIN